MMNSAVSAYPSHSYYTGGGEVRSVTNQAACASWSNPHSQTHAGIPSVFDYYPHTDYYSSYHTPLPPHCPTAGSTASTPSPHEYDRASSNYWANSTDPIYAQLASEGVYSQYAANGGKKKGVASNSKKERRRTISINGAFSNLRDCIPNVPKDTKLSKIKTLRLACGYIQHLMDALSSDNPQPIQEFKGDLSRKTPCRAEKRKCIEAEIAAAAERKSRGRSGWPQTIWAQELKSESNTPTDFLSRKPSFHSSDPQKSIPPLSKIKSEVASTQGYLDIADVPDPCTSCHSSLCEESSSNAGSLG